MSRPEGSPGAFVAGLFVPKPHRQAVFDALQLAFRDDGLPGKLVDGEILEHPIYACYVVQELQTIWEGQGRRDEYLEAAQIVADAAIARMREVGDALVYMYDDSPLFPERRGAAFYSALAQARYLKVLSQLGLKTGRADLLESARRVMRSLTIPSSQGGVMLERPYGPVLEEYPNEIPVYILNGWTTALVAILGYANDTGDRDARDFAIAGVEALLAIIDRFDVPELANTRYTLAGPAWLRLIASPAAGVRFTGGTVTLPADGTFEFTDRAGDRWENWYDSARVAPDGRLIDPDGICEANVVLSQSGDDFAVRFDVELERRTSIDIYLPLGEYDVFDSGMRVDAWKDHATFELAPGRHSLPITASMRELPLMGYPTNFCKRVAGRSYNAYHFLHVSNLRELRKQTGIEGLEPWLRRWEEYIARWPEMPVYRDADIELVHIPDGSRD